MKGLIGNPEEFAKKDLEFHVLLAKSTENPLFEIMLKPLIQSLLNVIRMALVYEPSSKEAIEFHNAIYRAIKNRDPQRARVSMSNHMNQTCAAVKSAIKNLVKE